MSVDRIYLQRSARNIEESPSYVPYSKVRIIVGEEEDGTQLVYEAGDDTFRTLEITNPYGTQAIANSILAKIQGYSYKPFKVDGAILNPVAEIGDAVNVGDVYSFLSSIDTTFSPIMSADISAPEDSNIDHEYPYESSENKEIARKINGAKASFIVELGRIEASLEDYQRKEDMDGYVEERTLNASIGAYIDSQAGTAKILLATSGTYQRKDQMGNYVLSSTLNASIEQYIDSNTGKAHIIAATDGTYQRKDQMSNYVLASSLNTSIGQYIDSQTGKAKIISAASGTYQTVSGMSNYVTTSSLTASIGQYIDTQTGKAKIVAACSGTYQTQSGMSNYVLQSSLNTSIGQYIDSRTGTAKIESAISATYQTQAGMSAYVQNNQLNNSITQYVNSTTGKNTIVASVSGSFAGKNYETRVEVSESKIGWLIKSGTSSSNFTMTDRAIQLTAGTIKLDGYVTFTNLSTQNDSKTIINGSNIRTGTIDASKVTVANINASNITTGTINADRINAETLRVKTIYAYRSNYVKVIDTSYTDTLYLGGDGTWNIKDTYFYSSRTINIGASNDWSNRLLIDTANKEIVPNNPTVGWKIGSSLKPFADIRTKNAHLCDSSGSSSILSFFGATGNSRRTLSRTSTNMGYTLVDSSNYLIVLNNIVGILANQYGMIGT